MCADGGSSAPYEDGVLRFVAGLPQRQLFGLPEEDEEDEEGVVPESTEMRWGNGGGHEQGVYRSSSVTGEGEGSRGSEDGDFETLQSPPHNDVIVIHEHGDTADGGDPRGKPSGIAPIRGEGHVQVTAVHLRHPLEEDDEEGEGEVDFISALSWRDYFTKVMGVALATAVDFSLSNMSMMFISLSLYTIVKSGSLVFALFLLFMLRLEEPRAALFFIILLVVGGICTASYGETRFNLYGFFLILGAGIASSIRGVLSQLLLQGKPPPNPVAHGTAHRHQPPPSTTAPSVASSSSAASSQTGGGRYLGDGFIHQSPSCIPTTHVCNVSLDLFIFPVVVPSRC